MVWGFIHMSHSLMVLRQETPVAWPNPRILANPTNFFWTHSFLVLNKKM